MMSREILKFSGSLATVEAISLDSAISPSFQVSPTVTQVSRASAVKSPTNGGVSPCSFRLLASATAALMRFPISAAGRGSGGISGDGGGEKTSTE